MAKTKVLLELPTTITASDYHEFGLIENVFDMIGLKVKILEMGVGNHGKYMAIVFKKKDKAFKALYRVLKQECDE